MHCAIAGDSIAVGVGAQLHGCAVSAKVGIPSAAIIGRVQDADVLVVSAGSNDPRNPHLAENLRAIRERATQRVVWIAPVDQHAAATVRRVAAEHGDTVVSFAPGPDHVHPKSYPTLARDVFAATQETR